MKITFIAPIAGLVGGLRVIAIHADLLRRRGHQVCVVSVPPRHRAIHEKLRSLWNGHGWPTTPKGDPWFSRMGLEHRVIDEHRAVTDDDVPDADVVVATWWETAEAVAGLSPSKGAKAYFVQDYGAHDGQPLEDVAETWHLPMHKLTISKWLIGLIAECSGDVNVTYVPNSVDFDVFHAPPRGKQQRMTVGFMYSPRPQKGTENIVVALKEAAEVVPGLRVLSYGPCDPVGDMPLPPDVEYHRRAPDTMLAEIYAQCDVWLFGSTKEGFGLPILEAMACRTPVIATPAGAAPELLAGGGGIPVCPDDPEDIAGAIEHVFEMSHHAWREMSDAAVRTATSWTWGQAADRFEAGLRTAIRNSDFAEPLAAG